MSPQITNYAFELVRKHGFVEALRIAEKDRDNNHPGTFTFLFHNQVVRQLKDFATVGAMYRTTK